MTLDAPAARIALAEAAAAAAVPPAPPVAPSRPVRFTGDRRAYLAAADPRRGAARRHARHLPVLARHRRAALPVVATPRSPARRWNTPAPPTELLIGFLIAIALLVPINVAVFDRCLEHRAKLGALVSMLGFPLLFVLGQFAVYRARRYRLTRTVYRGVRCHQDRLGAALCGLRDVLVDAGRADARARLSVRAVRARTLQDAPHLLRRSPAAGSRARACGCSCAAVPMWLPRRSVPLAGRRSRRARQPRLRGAVGAVAAAAIQRAIGELHDAQSRHCRPLYTASSCIVSAIGCEHRWRPCCCSRCSRRWCCAGGSAALRFGALTVRSQLRTAPIYGAYLRFLGLWRCCSCSASRS